MHCDIATYTGLIETYMHAIHHTQYIKLEISSLIHTLEFLEAHFLGYQFAARIRGADSTNSHTTSLCFHVCRAVMKTKCSHSSDKYQEINKNKVSKPNERLFIIGLVMSLAPSAQSFPPISLSNRGSQRRHSDQEVSRCRVSVRLPSPGSSILPPASTPFLIAQRKTSVLFRCKTHCNFTNLLMICDPFVDSKIVKPCTHNFSLNLYYSHHNRASHSISKC